MGLGRFGGGAGAVRWLASHGADVLITDLAEEGSLRETIDSLADCDVTYRLGGHDIADLDGADYLIVSPAVCKESSAFFNESVRRRIPWTTEINLFLAHCDARVVGVTGTAGKSTTAAMLHAILQRGYGVGTSYLGGNIGTSLLGALEAMTTDDVVVLELSSFQLADLPQDIRRPDVSVFVSLWPNHLDRHGTFGEYVDCKLNMVRNAEPGTAVVWGVDDADLTDALHAAIGTADVSVRSPCRQNGGFALRIPGAHNQHNAACAAAAARLLRVNENHISAALATFPGLPHRLQHVGTHREIDFFNDSKSTTAEATITALRAFDRRVVLLAGGQNRPGQCRALANCIAEHAKAAICFGPAGKTVLDAIRCLPTRSNDCTTQHHPRLKDAVGAAASLARKGDVVLLSPGFPSYDAFANYRERGAAFTALIG